MVERTQRPLTQLTPGDILEWRMDGREHKRLWFVHGCHHGGMTEESVICLEAIDRKPACDEISLPLMWVPEVLVRQCRIAGHYENRDEAAKALSVKTGTGARS